MASVQACKGRNFNIERIGFASGACSAPRKLDNEMFGRLLPHRFYLGQGKLGFYPNFRRPRVEIIGHSAGVRPCTATTRPHLGCHPENHLVLSFNGFGSKGYALSPYFAREFADWILCGKPLDQEADLSRHVRKFFKGSGVCLG